jgi:hypothetical protein
MAELSNGGRSTAAPAASASTRPDAASTGTASLGSLATRSSTSRCASSIEIRFRVAPTASISY